MMRTNPNPVSSPISTLLCSTVLVALAAGCGSDDSTGSAAGPRPEVSAPTVTDSSAGDTVPGELAPDLVVFVWTETGGCMMAGPNCARYEARVDGTVETFRGGNAGVEATGSVDPDLVAAWRDALLAEDIDALRARVGEGELTAAFDGVDYAVSDPVSGIELSSVATAFDRSEPIFAAAFGLVEAAAAAAPLEIQMR